jgi:hypothetical protein
MLGCARDGYSRAVYDITDLVDRTDEEIGWIDLV